MLFAAAFTGDKPCLGEGRLDDFLVKIRCVIAAHDVVPVQAGSLKAMPKGNPKSIHKQDRL
jgi:hypothetical protein